MDKILTIIVPSYNMEAYLSKCLGSLIIDDKELLPKLDVIVVNDGSKDRTSAIAHEFEAKHPGVFRVIDKENGNYGSCINVGLDCAMGTYVFVLDADDYVLSDAFAEYVGVVEFEAKSPSGGVDLIVSDYIHVSSTGDCLKRVDLGLTETAASLKDKTQDSYLLNVHSNAYKTENLRKIGYRQSEGMSYTDSEWMINPMIAVRRLRYFQRVVVCYLIGREGQTMEDATYAGHFQQVADITRSIVRFYSRHLRDAVDEAKDYYQRQVLGMIGLVYKTCLFGWNGLDVKVDLVAFDKALQEVPELYRLSDDLFLPSNHFPFTYVHEWRRRKSARTPKFLLFKMYGIAARIGGLLDVWRKFSAMRKNKT